MEDRKKKEIELLRQYFKLIEVRYFHFISLFAFPFLNLPGGKFVLELGQLADQAVLSIPLLRKYAFKVVFVCQNPRKN